MKEGQSGVQQIWCQHRLERWDRTTPAPTTIQNPSVCAVCSTKGRHQQVGRRCLHRKSSIRNAEEEEAAVSHGDTHWPVFPIMPTRVQRRRYDFCKSHTLKYRTHMKLGIEEN